MSLQDEDGKGGSQAKLGSSLNVSFNADGELLLDNNVTDIKTVLASLNDGKTSLTVQGPPELAYLVNYAMNNAVVVTLQ